MKFLNSLLILLFLTYSPLLQAAEDSKPPAKNKCDMSLRSKKNTDPVDYNSHEYVIIPSAPGRDDDYIPHFREFVEDMSKEGGALDKLGIPRTKQVVEFLNGVDMKGLTATPAAQPVAHFLDGSMVLNAIGQRRGGYALEVVYPGAKYQHGYYRDDNPFEWQISILMHVIGHNHFAVTSKFPHYRAAQATEVGIELNEALQHAYTVTDKADAENYYLWAQTLAPLMDYYSAYYQDPMDFDLDRAAENLPHFGDVASVKAKQNVVKKGLFAPTENVLAAFSNRVQNSDAPQWKKDLMALFPYTGIYRPALVHTQVMNEGWASIMQEIIMDHMGEKWNTFNHWFDAGHVISNEPQLNYKDPYWLGLIAWKRLKEKFFQRPEIAALETLLEKDRAFIRYAEEEFISQMDDFQFLNIALDDTQIQRMKLAIIRDATPEERRLLPEPPKDMPNPKPKVVVTKDPARLRQFVINSAVGAKTFYRPRVKLVSFNKNDAGIVELIINDDFGVQVPIDERSLGPALYALSGLLGQPVSLEATFKTLRKRKIEYDENDPWYKLVKEHYPDEFEIWFPPYETYNELETKRVEVTPSGSVRTYLVEREENGELKQESELYDQTRQIVEAHLHNYLRELHMEDGDRLSELESINPSFEKFALHSLAQTINGVPTTSFIEHVPSTADAISEYHSKVSSRMALAFQNAMKGNGGLVKTNVGLFLKALPSVHTISFDYQYLNQIAAQATPGEVDQAVIAKNPFDGDIGSGELIGPTDLGPGQGGWTPGPSDGQGGKGDEPGEPGDEPGEGQPGDAGLDPSWVPFPESLYAQFLGEKVKLPNLQSKAGKTRAKKEKLRGRENKRAGQLVVDKTAFNALKLGIGAEKALVDEETDTGELMELMDLGFSLMRPNDFVVKKGKPVNKPDSQAVVVFALDASASTWSHYDLYKRFVYDMKVLLKENYKNLEIVYLVFDTKVREAKSEKEFFDIKLGGGTSYYNATEAIRKIMAERYPASQWDRFPFVIGDLGDFWSQETQESFSSMVDESSFAGALKGGFGVQEFTNALEAMSQEKEFFGFVDLGDRPTGYSIEDIRKLLKNDAE